MKLEHPQDLSALRIRKSVGHVCFCRGDECDRTWDDSTPENRPKTIGNSHRVLGIDTEPSPGARLPNETVDEREARPGAEGVDGRVSCSDGALSECGP